MTWAAQNRPFAVFGPDAFNLAGDDIQVSIPTDALTARGVPILEVALARYAQFQPGQ